MNEIIVALITGGLSLLGIIISAVFSYKVTTNKIQQQLSISQAITDTKLEELTREVREHNNFAKRMPVVEKEIEHLNDTIHRLEDFHK